MVAIFCCPLDRQPRLHPQLSGRETSVCCEKVKGTPTSAPPILPRAASSRRGGLHPRYDSALQEDERKLALQNKWREVRRRGHAEVFYAANECARMWLYQSSPQKNHSPTATMAVLNELQRGTRASVIERQKGQGGIRCRRGKKRLRSFSGLVLSFAG